MEEDLKRKVKKGLSWVIASQIVNQVFFVGFAIYLARILDPSIFGVMGLISVLTNYAQYFLDLGFGTALVQKKNLDQAHLSTTFWFNLMVGFFLAILFYFSAPLVADFYKEPQLKSITRVVSVSFIITSFSLIQYALLDKQLNFKKKVTINWIANLCGYAFGIAMALNDFGVWSLVAQLLITQLMNTVILWLNSSWYPSFLFSWAKLKDILPFGLNVFGDTTINYWSRNADNFLIGKFIGSEGLGLYSRAYSLMLLPIRNVSSLVYKVMFPAFSSIQEDIPMIRSIYFRTIRYVAYITFPAMAGLTVVAKEFVFVCFGEKWMAMVPILQWLAILGAFQSILNLNGLIYNSIGKPHIAFRVSLVVSAILLISFVVGLMAGGLMGITIAYFLAGSVLSVPIYWMAIKQIGVTLSQVGKVLSGATVASVAVVLVVMVYKHLLNSTNDVFILTTSVFLGAVTYVLVLLLVDKEFKLIFQKYVLRVN